MIKLESLNPSIFAPPGSYLEYLQHPCGNPNLSIEKAIFKEHRFAFYYWNKWNKALNKKAEVKFPPTLISVDWHTDLFSPNEIEKEELKRLNLLDDNEVALFSWLRLHGNNDGHIKSAMYLNLLSDLVLLQRQNNPYKRKFLDKNNNEHKIFVFSDVNEFHNFIIERDDENIFLDIDLDYFIINSGDIAKSSDAELMLDEDAVKILDFRKGFLSPIINEIEGITIATEPGHCWGILNSLHFLELIERTFFNNDRSWKHLSC